MLRSAVHRAALLGIVALLTASGCTSGPPASSGQSGGHGAPEAQASPTAGPAPQAPGSAPSSVTVPPVFAPCGREPADASRTNLRPSLLTAADRALAGSWAEGIPDGELVVEAAAVLDVRDGILGAGDGYSAAVGGPEGTAQVAPTTVSEAPVSLAVLDSPSSGRRVAFVEIRLDPAPPVRWVEEPTLGIGTDGGDGGYLAPGSAPGALDMAAQDVALDRSLAAYFPDKDDPTTWNQCLARSSGGRVDGVLFSTGWGDGYYPTYLGQDADGTVVSVVSFGAVLPWNLSGLPGEAPPAAEVGP